jgi:hypothetical protein
MPALTKVNRVTAVLYVDKIEPCVSFWVDRLGFSLRMSVPHGDALGFVILEKDGTEIMYQSFTSAAADIPALDVRNAPGATAFFVEVSDVDSVEKSLAGLETLFPRRRTDYDTDEVCVREPGGRAVIFAQRVAE